MIYFDIFGKLSKKPIKSYLSKKLPLSITGVILLAKFDLSCFLLSFTCIFAQWIVCRRHGLASLCPFFLKAKRGYGRSELNARTKTEKNIYKKRKKRTGFPLHPAPPFRYAPLWGLPPIPASLRFAYAHSAPTHPSQRTRPFIVVVKPTC